MGKPIFDHEGRIIDSGKAADWQKSLITKDIAFGKPPKGVPSLSGTDPKPLVQYLIDSYVSGTPVPPKTMNQITERLGWMAGAGGKLNQTLTATYDTPLGPKTSTGKPRDGLQEFLSERFPDQAGSAMASFDKGAQRGTQLLQAGEAMKASGAKLAQTQ